MAEILGIHHVTAICGPAQENVDFYSGVLGLRLVKLTVNFDDPTAYHLYYGDSLGTPGTILTFFPYPDGYPGRPGRHQATVTTLTIPRDSVAYWVDRFRENEVEFDKPHNRDGGQVIAFRAPDGLPLELLALSDHLPTVEMAGSPVPANRAVGKVRSVLLMEDQLDQTSHVMELLGLKRVAEGENNACYACGDSFLDVVVDPIAPEGRGGHGSVHHIALRCADGAAQLEIRQMLISEGLHVSPVMDRTYFKSIYFREPGGVLLEIATDMPGFAADEPPEALGKSLRLPPQYEDIRFKIARRLPPLELPRWG